MIRKTLAQSAHGERHQETEDDIRTPYEQLQYSAFCFLERPSTKVAIIYHITNLVFIFGSIVISVLSTIESYENSKSFQVFIFWYEIGLLCWFCCEYLIRAWSCSVLKRYRGWGGRFRFVRTFYMCIDVFIIMSTTTTAVLQVKTSYFTLLRTTRFLQVFRILRLDRQKGDLGMMFNVVYKHRKELITCYFVGFIILFGGAYIVYIIEKASTEASINNMANGLYWALITVTSVGYGDISPVTWAGKIMSGIFALVGCAFFALPAGILGSGFALQVAKQRSRKKFFKIRNPAAILIQTAWRNHAVKRYKHTYQGTWNYLVPQITGTVQWPGYYSCLPGINAICNAKSFDAFDVPFAEESKPTNNVSSLKKISWSRRSASSYTYELPEQIPMTSRGRAWSHFANAETTQRISFATRRVHSLKKKLTKIPTEKQQARYKSAIRFILRIKFWTCIKNFKNKRYPFVEMQDIREKNSHWHFKTVSFLRDMQSTTVKLRHELRDMKLALHCKVNGHAALALKRKCPKSNKK